MNRNFPFGFPGAIDYTSNPLRALRAGARECETDALRLDVHNGLPLSTLWTRH